MTDFGRSPQIPRLHAQKTHTFIDGVVFDSTDEDYTSDSRDVSNYRDFGLLIDLDVTLAPTDIVVRVQFSDDDVTYRDYMNGPFGDLRYEDGAGDKNEAVVGKVIAPYMKIYALSSGCDGTNKFALTAKVVLSK